MPLRLEIKELFQQKSERDVISVDLHPTEPWILVSLSSGTVCIWDYPSKTVVRSLEVTELPVGSAKFIAQKNWVVAGADDKRIHVYNYNNGHKVKEFEAHTGFIRCVAVHASLPYVLSSSDDMLIKLWNWDKGWEQTHRFCGHSGSVMQVTFNPKEANAFASASRDSTIKIWNIGKNIPTCTLNGHKKGVNCVAYSPGANSTHLITGSDDCTAKVWDYRKMSCVRTLEGHEHNVSAVCFHPVLPIIITGSEDERVRIWHSASYSPENTLTYGLARVSAFSYLSGSIRFLIGHDRGTVMVNLGSEAPVASMDRNGNIIWSRDEKIQCVNVLSAADYHDCGGEKLPVSVEKLDFDCQYQQSLKHSPNGKWVVVCGDGEYTIYRASKWEYILSGQALEFVWSLEGEYAVWLSNSTFKIFTEDSQEKRSITADFQAEHIYGGHLLAICSKSFICFYDWTEFRLIRRIDLNVKNLYWAPQGAFVAIVSDTSCHILKYNQDVVSANLGRGRLVNEKGIDNAFEKLYAFEDQVMAGFWYKTSFVYTNSSWTLNFFLNGEVTEISKLGTVYMLGFVDDESCVYFIDKEYKYTLSLGLIDFKFYKMMGNEEKARQCLREIPDEKHNDSLAQIAEALGDIKGAHAVARDPVYKAKLYNQLFPKDPIEADDDNQLFPKDPIEAVDDHQLFPEDPMEADDDDYVDPAVQAIQDQLDAQDVMWTDRLYGDSFRPTDPVYTVLKRPSGDGKFHFKAKEVEALARRRWFEAKEVEILNRRDRPVKMQDVAANEQYDMIFIPTPGEDSYTIGGPGWEKFHATVAAVPAGDLRIKFRKIGTSIPTVCLAAPGDPTPVDVLHMWNASSCEVEDEDEDDFDPDPDYDPNFYDDM